jgi:serine/threonine protein kinase
MHSKKIAYRDLKPENLVMDHIGYVKVVDFGLAKVIIGGKTWTLCGTPAYLAPEIVLNDGHDWSVDYWALGVFLFEMTSGKEPFAAKNPMEVYKKIVSGHVEIPPNFSSPLTDLIRKLLNTSKSKRLGRTMGGGGAVMQHNWYSDFDWDAHLEKRLEVPLQPRTQEVLGEDSVVSVTDSKDSSDPSPKSSMSVSQHSQSKEIKAVKGTVLPVKPPRLTYSLGQGNRHHQKLLEMMDSSVVEHDSERQVDTVRMTMLRVIKQHERWSKTSRESSANSISSTRNTFLNTGMKDVSTRSSLNTEGGASIRSSALGENDECIRLQGMNLSLASKCFSQISERDRAYQQFSLISLCTASLVRGTSESRGFGHRFLDPFVTKKFELIDQYASGISKTDIDAEALAAFCFPNGLRIRLVPRCAIEGAKRLGWLGENSDSYQIQGFTDVAGSLSHGCAITIKEELKTNDARAVSLAISLYRNMRRSARVVGRWWIKQHRRQRSQLKPRPMVTRAHSMVEKASSMKWGRKGSDKLVVSMNGLRRSNIRSTSLGDVAGTDTETSDDSVGEDECSTTPEHIRLLGQSAYKAMIDAEKEGDICIVEKCYVLTGTRLQEQSLLFCALQNLINMDRNLNDKPGRMSFLKRHGSSSKDQRTEGIQYSFVSRE